MCESLYFLCIQALASADLRAVVQDRSEKYHKVKTERQKQVNFFLSGLQNIYGAMYSTEVDMTVT